MMRLHIQVDSPKYEAALPAHCTAKVHGDKMSVLIWESYINPRTSRVVYLSTALGRYLMISEEDIDESTVEHVCGWEEVKCQQKQQ